MFKYSRNVVQRRNPHTRYVEYWIVERWSLLGIPVRIREIRAE